MAGDYFADDANIARAGAHTPVGATVGSERPIGRATLRAFVAGHNLAGTSHVASVFINGTNGEFYEPGLPRSWAAGLTMGWQ